MDSLTRQSFPWLRFHRWPPNKQQQTQNPNWRLWLICGPNLPYDSLFYSSLVKEKSVTDRRHSGTIHLLPLFLSLSPCPLFEQFQCCERIVMGSRNSREHWKESEGESPRIKGQVTCGLLLLLLHWPSGTTIRLTRTTDGLVLESKWKTPPLEDCSTFIGCSKCTTWKEHSSLNLCCHFAVLFSLSSSRADTHLPFASWGAWLPAKLQLNRKLTFLRAHFPVEASLEDWHLLPQHTTSIGANFNFNLHTHLQLNCAPLLFHYPLSVLGRLF